jgi:hypothetical protein
MPLILKRGYLRNGSPQLTRLKEEKMPNRVGLQMVRAKNEVRGMIKVEPSASIFSISRNGYASSKNEYESLLGIGFLK